MVGSVRLLCVDGGEGSGRPLPAGLDERRERFDVVAVDDVGSARERLESSTVDCVVSTYRLPDGDGLELLEGIRESHPGLPFVLVAADGSESVASGAIEADVTSYLPEWPDGDQFGQLADRITEAVAEYRRERDTSERLRILDAILENVPLFICTVDASGTVTRVQGQGLDGTGLDDERTPGTTASELFADTPAVVEGYGSALDGAETSAVMEVGDHVFQSWFQPLGGPDGGGAVLLAVDITERREREQELEQRNERLERVASVISHDLRSPLQIAQGHLQVAEETGEEASFERAREAQRRIEEIIEDVLTLARTGRMIVETERVELDEIAREAWRTVDTSSIRLVVDGNCEMDAEPNRCKRLFENLFRNSLEHGVGTPSPDPAGDPGGAEDDGVTVTVGSIELLPTSTRATDDAVRGFYVADDGPGIPPDERDDVLEWGYTTAPDGTGFGLAIVNQIAEAHGWDVSVTESYQGGARFEFTGPEFRQVR